MKRKLLLAGFCVAGFFVTHAQTPNKTLGVGTTNPNTNAALHVESPTANQGFIMPRLTTSQRNAMAGLLTISDNGLMLYDTDLSTIYIWDGTKWKSTAEVAGGAKLAYPYKDSVTAGTGTSDLFKLQYNNAEPKRLMRLENLNASNGSSTLSALQLGSGIGGFFQVNNSTNGGTAVYGTTNSNLGGTVAPVGVYGESTGTGSLAAAFRINNPANNYSTVYAETNGTGPVLTLNNINASNTAPALNITGSGTGLSINASGDIQAGKFIGDGSMLNNLPPLSLPFTASQGDSAALIDITNMGTHAAIRGVNSGTGSAAIFENINSSNPLPALFVTTNGAVDTTNVSSSAAIVGETASAFSAIIGRSTGGVSNGVTGLSVSSDPGSYAILGENSGMGVAGAFSINNAANLQSALEVTTSGAGTGMFLLHSGSGPNTHGAYLENGANTTGAVVFAAQLGTGRAGQFQITNNANTSAALRAFTSGGGNAGYFTINNIGSTMPGVFSETNGSGAAIQGENTGTGNGFAGLFRNTDAANTYPAIQAETFGMGPGVRVMQTTGLGGGMDIYMENTASSAMGMSVNHKGTGTAGNFVINNVSSNATALYAGTDGTGSAVSARNNGNGRAGYFHVDNGASVSAAVTVTSNGVGAASLESFHTGTGDAIYAQSFSGNAGDFQIINASNTNAALSASTNAPNGYSLGLSHDNPTASGVALALLSGGIKLSTQTIAGDSVINTRAAAYFISGGAPSSLNFSGTIPLNEGDVFYFYNSNAYPVTVGPVQVPATSGRTVIYLGGDLRGF